MNYSVFSLLWAMIRHPFTDGPRLIKEHGTWQKGLALFSAVLMFNMAVSYIYMMPRLTVLQSVESSQSLPFGPYFLTIIFLSGFVLAPLYVAVYGAIFNKIARAMDGESTFTEIFKVLLYLSAYNSLVGLLNITRLYMEQIDSVAVTILGGLASLGLMAWVTIVALYALSYAIKLSKWNTAAIGILSYIGLCIVCIIIGVAFVVSFIALTQ